MTTRTMFCVFTLLLLNVASGYAKSCGRTEASLDVRVIGGHIISPTAWPWVVRLVMKDKKKAWRCTGSIVSPKFVLTAAHCILLGDTKHIQPGQVSLHGANGDIIDAEVGSVHLPPGSSRAKNNRHRDVAILELNKPFPAALSTSVCLPLEYRENVGEYGYFAGFGDHEDPVLNYTRDNHARENILPFRSLKECEFDVKTPHSEEWVCTGGFYRGAWKGDSGGPLMVNVRGTFYQVGVFSMLRVARPPARSKFSRVSPLCDWIANITRGEAACVGVDDE